MFYRYLFVKNIQMDTVYIHRDHPRASTIHKNSSFVQQPAKCKALNWKQYTDRQVLLGVKCYSIFGCCTFPGFPQSTTSYL